MPSSDSRRGRIATQRVLQVPAAGRLSEPVGMVWSEP